MKVDLYTKSVLTIIAICLLIITINQIELIPRVNANDSNYKSNDYVEYRLVPVNSAGAIDVNIVSSYTTLDVNIESCSTSAFYQAEPIEVKIK